MPASISPAVRSTLPTMMHCPRPLARPDIPEGIASCPRVCSRGSVGSVGSAVMSLERFGTPPPRTSWHTIVSGASARVHGASVTVASPLSVIPSGISSVGGREIGGTGSAGVREMGGVNCGSPQVIVWPLQRASYSKSSPNFADADLKSSRLTGNSVSCAVPRAQAQAVPNQVPSAEDALASSTNSQLSALVSHRHEMPDLPGGVRQRSNGSEAEIANANLLGEGPVGKEKNPAAAAAAARAAAVAAAAMVQGSMALREAKAAEWKEAADSLRLFFTDDQVRSMATTPPEQYTMPREDPLRRSSSLAQGLRLALELLGQESIDGNRFRNLLANQELALVRPSVPAVPTCSPGENVGSTSNVTADAQASVLATPVSVAPVECSLQSSTSAQAASCELRAASLHDEDSRPNRPKQPQRPKPQHQFSFQSRNQPPKERLNPKASHRMDVRQPGGASATVKIEVQRRRRRNYTSGDLLSPEASEAEIATTHSPKAQPGKTRQTNSVQTSRGHCVREAGSSSVPSEASTRTPMSDSTAAASFPRGEVSAAESATESSNFMCQAVVSGVSADITGASATTVVSPPGGYRTLRRSGRPSAKRTSSKGPLFYGASVDCAGIGLASTSSFFGSNSRPFVGTPKAKQATSQSARGVRSSQQLQAWPDFRSPRLTQDRQVLQEEYSAGPRSPSPGKRPSLITRTGGGSAQVSPCRRGTPVGCSIRTASPKKPASTRPGAASQPILASPGQQFRNSGPTTPSAETRKDRTGRNGTPTKASAHLRKERELCKQAVAAAVAASLPTAARRVTSPGRLGPNSSIGGLDFYALGKPLGKGAFGKVNVAVHKLTEELTAMKLCERKKISEIQAQKCLNQEVLVLTCLNGHPNVIQLFEVVETMTHVVLVMEFATNGDLLRFVRHRGKLSEACASDLYKQLVDGLKYIHQTGVVHRDIKLENILLDVHNCVKIADFGVAAFLKPNGKLLAEHCGTPSYIAPEILLEAGYVGPPVDAWSSGIVLYAMLCGRVPFKGDQFSDLKKSILSGRFSLPPRLSANANCILRALLTVDPNRRLSVDGILAHSWLSHVSNRAKEIHKACSAVPIPGEGEFRVSRHICAKVTTCGFPQTYTEESLRDGRLNHATATYNLLAKQEIHRRAAKTPGIGTEGPGSGQAEVSVETALDSAEVEPDAEEVGGDPYFDCDVTAVADTQPDQNTDELGATRLSDGGLC